MDAARPILTTLKEPGKIASTNTLATIAPTITDKLRNSQSPQRMAMTYLIISTPNIYIIRGRMPIVSHISGLLN